MRILLVDWSITRETPAWASYFIAKQDLLNIGCEFTHLSWRSENDSEDYSIRLSEIPVPDYLKPLVFCIAANLYCLKEGLAGRLQRFDVIIGNESPIVFAGVHYLHFSYSHYYLQQKIMPRYELRDQVEDLLVKFVCKPLQDIVIAISRNKKIITVSHAIQTILEKQLLSKTRIYVLPNISKVNVVKPNLYADSISRLQMRSKLGLKTEDMVFSFCCQGHFRRKGFYLAVGALDRLRRQHQIKLLIIGGREATITRIKKILDRYWPEHSEFCVWVGSVADARVFLDASNAFLFPSYSEAFSLATIEAASLGLRLYLTPHPGTEMFSSYENKVIMSWDEKEIAKRIAADIKTNEVSKRSFTPYNGISQNEWAKQWVACLKDN